MSLDRRNHFDNRAFPEKMPSTNDGIFIDKDFKPLQNIENIMAKPLDYFMDHSGWIHIVKAVINPTLFISKPLYAPGLVKKKYKTKIEALNHPPNGTPCTFADTFDYLIEKDKIQRWFRPRAKLLTTSQLPKNRPDLRYLVDKICHKECKAYLFGSRLLNIESENSDWDIIIESDIALHEIVSKIVELSGGSLRFFSSSECCERIKRYGSTQGLLSTETLEKLFQATTVYLKSSLGEIGIFSGNLNTMANNLEQIDFNEQDTIVGIITETNGLSHCMPRCFDIDDEEKGRVTIVTTIWPIGGLELLAGRKVRIRGVNKIDSSSKLYWLGGPLASFRILN